VLLVHQVVACAEGHQAGVVGGRGDGHGARAADVRVTQLVGEDLQLVRREAIVVPEDVVVRGPTGALKKHNTRTVSHTGNVCKQCSCVTV